MIDTSILENTKSILIASIKSMAYFTNGSDLDSIGFMFNHISSLAATASLEESSDIRVLTASRLLGGYAILTYIIEAKEEFDNTVNDIIKLGSSENQEQLADSYLTKVKENSANWRSLLKSAEV